MGISRTNGEGYPDPTAHIAVRNVEADAKKLKINYPTGYIELNLEHFFPCPQAKAKKVFRLSTAIALRRIRSACWSS